MTADESTITLGAYLLGRLEQLGSLVIQGVPGDYNMGFLDLIEDHASLRWVGNCNELNAAYSSDGYARTAKRAADSQQGTRVGTLVTTFGVGELSALNGVAGCFSERIPLVHIVGVPSTSSQGEKALLHHTLGDGRFDAFEEMSRKISIALVKLADYASDPKGAVSALDRALTVGVLQARPVYISLPTDLVHMPVSAKPLQTPLTLHVGPNDEDAEKNCLDVILQHIERAKDIVVLVDACAIRHGVVRETLNFVNASGLSVFTTPMGKSAIDESHPQFGGMYIGSNTDPAIKERVERADLMIQIGSLLSDFNTASFTYRTPRTATVQLHSDRVEVGFATFKGVCMKPLLPKLSDALRPQREKRLEATKALLPPFTNQLPTPQQEIDQGAPAEVVQKEGITQAWLWPRFGQFLRPGDQVLAETGTSSFGALAIRLPSHDLPCFHSQVLWGSIGWALPATLGVALASREEVDDKRVILFIGDGSFQLTAQEISTMVREGLSPIIVVLSNDGYEIERQIHGPERSYNNTARWDFQSFLQTFKDVDQQSDIPRAQKDDGDFTKSHAHDGKQSKIRYDVVRTKAELDSLLTSEAYASDKEAQQPLRLLEIILPRGDAPKALLGQAKATQKANAY